MNIFQNLTKAELVVIISSLLAIVIGAGLEFLLGDCSNMFQRFGSIVVCIGIVFGTLDIKSIYIEKYDQLKKNTDEKRLENDIVFSDNELD